MPEYPNGETFDVLAGARLGVTAWFARRFGHFDLGHWCLFRISDFGFRYLDLVAVTPRGGSYPGACDAGEGDA